MRFALKIIVLVLAMTNSPMLNAQVMRDSDPEYKALQERMCAETACQRNLRVTLKQKDGTLYDRTYEAFNTIVQDFGITVVAGQTVYVEADIENGRLVNLKSVDKIVSPDKTLTAKFEQSEDGGMLLTVSNPFDQTIKFDMGIAPLDKEELYRTSSCPINKTVFEMWPEPIFLVVLGNGRVAGSEETACK